MIIIIVNSDYDNSEISELFSQGFSKMLRCKASNYSAVYSLFQVCSKVLRC